MAEAAGPIPKPSSALKASDFAEAVLTRSRSEQRLVESRLKCALFTSFAAIAITGVTFALYAEEDDMQKVTTTVESLFTLLHKSFRP